MMDINPILQGLMGSLNAIWLIFGGVVFGLYIGAIPGFSSGNTLVVLLPILISIEPDHAIVFMAATYCGAEMGGSYPAILVNVPGVPGAIATTFDGYMMAKKGMAQQAIAISAVASGMGGLLTTALVLLAIPLLAKMALMFGTIQNFIIIIFGITLIGKLSGKSFGKGLLVGVFGLLLGATGFDPIYDTPRATFGLIELYDGMPPIAVLVGVFAISECIFMLEKETVVDPDAIEKVMKQSLKDSWEGVRLALQCWTTLVRSSIAGLIVGIIPGAGGSIAGLLAYQQETAAYPDKKFGEGEPSGVLAPEAANNAVITGSLIPTFTLGIPGSTTAIVILIVMEAHGFLIGPTFMEKHPEIVYLVISSMLFGNIFLFLTAFLSAKYFARVTALPTRILIPSIIVVSLIAAYAPRTSTIDIFIAFIFGILGYVLRNHGFPTPPLIIGVVLGPYAEEYFLRGLRLGHGSLLIFFKDPVSIILWGIFILSIIGPLIYKYKRK